MRTFLIFALICVFGMAKAQIKLTSGQYTTADGYYTVTINFEGSTLTLIEPNLTSIYTKVSGNVFSYVHPKSKTDYRIEVMDPSTIQTFKVGSENNRYTIKLSSTSMNSDNEQFKTYSAMAERYKTKMETDKKDAQLWSFCAAAAYARSTMNEEGFSAYAEKIVSSIKQIITNKTKCPCEDAIPATIWSSVK